MLETARLQCQVIALAMSCGRTHAATLQIGNGNDATQYTINGRKYERFHHISHRINSDGSDGTPIDQADVKHHDIDKMFAGIFKTLLSTLDGYKTATGTLLDEGFSVTIVSSSAKVSSEATSSADSPSGGRFGAWPDPFVIAHRIVPWFALPVNAAASFTSARPWRARPAP